MRRRMKIKNTMSIDYRIISAILAMIIVITSFPQRFFSEYVAGMDETYSELQNASASYKMSSQAPEMTNVNFFWSNQLAYNGAGKQCYASIAGPNLTENTDYIVLYTGRNSTVYNSTTAPVYPGDYEASFKLTQAGYQKAFLQNNLIADFTITKAVLTPNAISNVTKYYDSTTNLNNVGNISFTGKVGNDDVSISASSAAFENSNVGSNKNITISGLSLIGEQSNYYTLASNSFSVANGEIKENVPGEVTAAMFDNKAVTYNGTEQANNLNSMPQGVAEVTYTYQGIGETSYGPTAEAPKNAGTYSVTAAFIMQTGYTQLGDITKNFTINKADIAVSGISAQYKIYDGNQNVNHLYDYHKKILDKTSP